MLVTKTVKIVTNISKLSPTNYVSNIRHQHRCSPLFEFYSRKHGKDQDNITLVYAGFGDECKVEDLDSLRTYKFRLTVEIDGSKISTSSDWISITTNKEPFR